MGVARHPKKVAGYTVERPLGRGGMGEVLLARHEMLERLVALKRLTRGQTDEEPAEGTEVSNARFVREGRLLAQLGHEGICCVYDLVVTRGVAWLVLEYVDGYDLKQLLKRAGTFPLDVTAMIGIGVAEALHHAHARGIVHRDIKPGNVMISRIGAVKLMDFGIATSEDSEQLTKTGLIVGTPVYLAPEVLRGGPPSARSDLYALGVMLYRCLSGRTPFPDGSDDALFANIAAGSVVPIRSVAPRVPRRLARLVHTLLHRTPEKRPADGAAVAMELRRILAALGAEADHHRRLVAWLHSGGHLTQEEALTVVADPDMLVELSRAVERPSRAWVWVAGSVGIVAAAVAVAWAVATGTIVWP